jgi:hypothetical protein
MSNGQQAMADSARPVRSGGVLVNFPTAPVHPPEWPATRAAEEPTGSNPLSHDEPRLELQLCRSDATQWDDQSFSTPPGTTGSEPEPDASQCPVFSDNELSENPDPALRNRTALLRLCNRSLCRLMNPSFSQLYRSSRRGVGWSGGYSRTLLAGTREVARGSRRRVWSPTSGPAGLPSRSRYGISVPQACTW